MQQTPTVVVVHRLEGKSGGFSVAFLQSSHYATSTYRGTDGDRLGVKGGFVVAFLKPSPCATNTVHIEVDGSYHWLELPQVSFLSRQKFCRHKHVFVTTKHIFCRDKSRIVATKIFCRDKHNFVFVATKVLSDKNDTCDSSRQFIGSHLERIGG